MCQNQVTGDVRKKGLTSLSEAVSAEAMAWGGEGDGATLSSWYGTQVSGTPFSGGNVLSV